MSECENSGFTDYDLFIRAMTKWGSAHKVPVDATFELTPYCNFRCPMCYVRLTPEQARARGELLTTGQWLEIVRQAKEMGTLTVNITGGEPLLYPGFWDIYEACARAGIIVSVLSNGYLIDETAVARFKSMPPKGIVMSLYGASDETYASMCGVKNGFTHIDHAIDLLKDAGIPVALSVMVVKENRHDLEAMLNYAYGKGVIVNHVEGVVSSVRGANTSPAESRLTMEVSEDKWSLERLEKLKRVPMKSAFETCRRFGATYVITWNGHMQFCTYVDKQCVPLTFPLDLPAVWKQMLSDAEAIPIPPDCATCEAAEFCYHCPGRLAAESGDPTVVSPGFCEKPKKLAALYKQRKAEHEKTGSLDDTAAKLQ